MRYSRSLLFSTILLKARRWLIPRIMLLGMEQDPPILGLYDY